MPIYFQVSLMDVFLLCLWIANIIQLFKTKPPVGRREAKGIISTLCRVDFIILFLSAMAAIAFPKMFMGAMVRTEFLKKKFF